MLPSQDKQIDLNNQHERFQQGLCASNNLINKYCIDVESKALKYFFTVYNKIIFKNICTRFCFSVFNDESFLFYLLFQ